MMEYEHLIRTVKDRVAWIMFNRPHVLNAYNERMSRELIEAVAWCSQSKEVKVVVLTGAGKAFMAGADISMLDGWTRLEGGKAALKKILEGFFSPTALEECPKPIIAAVNGAALGMGCEIAMGCDIRIASERATFGQPEINLGIMTGAGGSQRMARLIGPGKTMELLLTGKQITAEEAFQWGLIDRVVPDGLLSDTVEKLAQEISTKSMTSLQYTKQAVVAAYSTRLPKGIAYELDLFASIFESPDAREGIRAFLEKRKPCFT